MKEKRLPWTTEQAKTMYLVIEALRNQFQAENLLRERRTKSAQAEDEEMSKPKPVVNSPDLSVKSDPRKWLACGLCHGTGKQSSYEDTWDCPPCEGKGGSWI